jgi:tetratricopeptide (TPR) repeat protein
MFALALLYTLDALAEEPAAPAEPATPAAPAALSEADLERAKQLYQNGAQLYAEGVYDKAILAFQESYALTKNHKLLFNIANAQERLGELQASVDTLNTYRIYADPAERDTLDRRIRGLEQRLDAEKTKVVIAPPPVVLAPVTPAPVAPVVEPKRSPVRPILIGTGSALAVGFGVATGLSYAAGLDNRDAGDQSSYESMRTVNLISLPLTGVGAGLALLGVAIPGTRTSITAGPGITRLHWTF